MASFRRDKFNASEAGAVMGVGFIKPYELAAQKYGNAKSNTYVNEAMRLGHEYEPRLREHLNDTMSLNLKPAVFQSDDDGRFCASLDGYDAGADTFCEIKFSSDEYEYVKQTGAPSEKYFWQIQHQFYACNIKNCIFCVGRLNDSFELDIITLPIKRDDEAIKRLIKAWNEFEATYKDSKLDDEWASLSDELSAINKQIKALQARADELKERAIEKADGKEIKAYSLTIYKTQRKASFDYASYCKAKGLIPDEAYAKPASISWSVRVN